MIRQDTNNTCRNNRPPSRRGFVLIGVVVVLAISLTLFGVWAQAAVRQHGRLRSQQLRLQAVRLAESGLARAMARRGADAQYTGETWSVPAPDLGTAYAAEVRIRIAPTREATALRFEATAEVPADSPRRAKITRRIEIPGPMLGGQL